MAGVEGGKWASAPDDEHIFRGARPIAEIPVDLFPAKQRAQAN
jgi:hypothetical protein